MLSMKTWNTQVQRQENPTTYSPIIPRSTLPFQPAMSRRRPEKINPHGSCPLHAPTPDPRAQSRPTPGGLFNQRTGFGCGQSTWMRNVTWKVKSLSESGIPKVSRWSEQASQLVTGCIGNKSLWSLRVRHPIFEVASPLVTAGSQLVTGSV